jgi:hypothetical protein
MVIDKINLKCKVHGMTVHGIYRYSDSIVLHCLECVRERKALRIKDPEKYSHDKEYTKKWVENHKEYVAELMRQYAKSKKDSSDKRVKQYLSLNEQRIKEYLGRIKSPLSFESIEKRCLRNSISNWVDIKRFILINKKSTLFVAEEFKQSSIVKYHFGVRENWAEVPEILKLKIRKKYRLKAKKIVNEKMKELKLFVDKSILD